MIIPLEPALEGLAERRFLGFARQMLDCQAAGESEGIGDLVEAEASLAPELRELEGQRAEYTACVRVLGDLAQLRWQLVKSGHGLELHSPRPQDSRGSAPCEMQMRKEAVRRELRPRLRRQFADPNVRKFVSRLEEPGPSSRHRSIRALIADGAELRQRLLTARGHHVGDPARTDALRQAVRPYMQLVEPHVCDAETGIPLRDIWRYFRYTWSIPQTPIPGRNLLYLVRDAAHEHHAVIGIAALGNSAVQLVPRDRAIGWSALGLTAALTALFAPPNPPGSGDPPLALQGIFRWLLPQFLSGEAPPPDARQAALDRVFEWLTAGIADAIGEIEHQGLVTADDLLVPTREVIDRLRRLSKEFAAQRQEALAGSGESGVATTPSLAEAPVDDAVLDLEAKHATNAPVNESRRMLVRKKRAFELARLLDAQRILAVHRNGLTDPETVLATLDLDEVRTAVNAAMSAIKGRRIGTNILEITTCGAVAPYNRMLGGKLVALLLLSPQVVADYRQRYGSEPAIIRSQLRNRPVVPDNTLVWLGTTSLFAHGSSQYERLRLPAGLIAADQPEIRYRYLGDTTGYGTVQFADDTVRALDSVMRRRRGYRDVNSVFGEGASPRMRKLRSGLDAIGFNASLTMIHHQERRIYGVPLFPEAAAYLCGLERTVPGYVRSPETCPDASERIAEFWRQRWLSRRLEHDTSWKALGETGPWLLSDSMPDWETPAAPPSSAGDGVPDDGDGSDDDAEIDFWRRLARAGANAVSEGLSEPDFERLHLPTPLEEELLVHLRKNRSLVLTGNAGDGKTHLARALKRRLAGDAERIVFEFDATASMTSGSVSPLVETWRQAVNEGKALVLAINQYPLHMLRRDLPRKLPDVSEALERQWRARLRVDPSEAQPNAESLLLVDLSLRNPLSRSFAGRVMNRLLDSGAVQRFAESDADPNFTFNFRCLSHPMVQERLFDLFERVVSSGRRATIRELWILCARLLFGASDDPGLAGSHPTWYSERLFEPDVRFPLTDALARVADPARVSHPQIDLRLENPRGTEAADWKVDSKQPPALPSPVSGSGPSRELRDRYRNRFTALKRRFYFEHAEGERQRCSRSTTAPTAGFTSCWTGTTTPSICAGSSRRSTDATSPTASRGSATNCACGSATASTSSRPRPSLQANASRSSRLGLRRPRPPDPLAAALDHVPDHLLLGLRDGSGAVAPHLSLHIDAALLRHALVNPKRPAEASHQPRGAQSPGQLRRPPAGRDAGGAARIPHLQRRARRLKRRAAHRRPRTLPTDPPAPPGRPHMNKRDAHFRAFGYEPLRMKPAHFASGFFTALTGRVYADELLNRVAVTSAGRGLLESYSPERVLETLKEKRLIADGLTQPDVELLRKQVNGIVDNDAAMFPAHRPYRAKGNDYTFISPRLLTTANPHRRLRGVLRPHRARRDRARQDRAGRRTRALANEPSGTLEQFVEPLLRGVDPQPRDLRDKYEEDFGVLDPAEMARIAAAMRVGDRRAPARLRRHAGLQPLPEDPVLHPWPSGLVDELPAEDRRLHVIRDAAAALRFSGGPERPHPLAESGVLRAAPRERAAVLYGIRALGPIRSRPDRSEPVQPAGTTGRAELLLPRRAFPRPRSAHGLCTAARLERPAEAPGAAAGHAPDPHAEHSGRRPAPHYPRRGLPSGSGTLGSSWSEGAARIMRPCEGRAISASTKRTSAATPPPSPTD